VDGDRALRCNDFEHSHAVFAIHSDGHNAENACAAEMEQRQVDVRVAARDVTYIVVYHRVAGNVHTVRPALVAGTEVEHRSDYFRQQ
jgi:hypothetical protein